MMNPEPGPVAFGPPGDWRKWVEAANIIARRRADGTYPDGTWMPSARPLAKELGVSHRTMSEAMTELRKAGLVTLVNNRLGYFAGTGTPPRERRTLIFPRQPYKWRNR